MEKSLQERLHNINARVSGNEQSEVISSPTQSKIKSLEDYIDSKRINIYSRSWNKLEIKLKKKKIEEFMDDERTDKNIPEETSTKVKKILYRLLRRDKLNKASEVTYDKEICKIKTIKNLSYDEEKQYYIWKSEIIN